MRRGLLFLINVISVLLWALAAQAEEVEGKIFYTTANIWYEDRTRIESTNYHRGQILPVGTKVKITKFCDGKLFVGGSTVDQKMWEIYFEFTDQTDKLYKLVYISRHAAPGSNVWNLFKQYFSQNDPTAEGGAFSSLTSDEQKMVRAGEIAPGMSKTAVIMAYGYPPGHKTPSLQLNKWIYWETLFKTRAVYFKDDQVISDSQKKKQASSIEECIKACKEYTNRTSEQCFDECKPK